MKKFLTYLGISILALGALMAQPRAGDRAVLGEVTETSSYYLTVMFFNGPDHTLQYLSGFEPIYGGDAERCERGKGRLIDWAVSTWPEHKWTVYCTQAEEINKLYEYNLTMTYEDDYVDQRPLPGEDA